VGQAGAGADAHPDPVRPPGAAVPRTATLQTYRPARRRKKRRGFVDFEEVTTCLPVIQEVLQGLGEERHVRAAREAMLALPRVESPLSLELFEEAIGLYRAARRAGLTIRSGVTV
jgi:predicted ATPase